MAIDFFLKLDGIDGEVTDTAHKGEIRVLSLQHGAHVPVSVGSTGKGLTTGKANVSEITFMKKMDKSSPKLFQSCVSGAHIKTAKFTAVKAGGIGSSVPFYTIDITDVVISSVSVSSHDETPMESISFAFSTIKATYVEQNEKGQSAGTSAATWNNITNTDKLA